MSTKGFSSIERAISDLAAVGAPTRIAMTIGFVVFGLGLFAFGFALRESLDGHAWIAAIATGASTIGVAANPLGGWTSDGVHATFAGLGYATLVALPLLAARPLARGGRRVWARASVWIGAISAACLLASTLGPAHGLWQRLGLTAGDAWIVATAAAIVAGVGQLRAGES
jgi:cytochrome bd-type quinol oxidase subunit 1